MTKNPKIEISCAKGAEWIRICGEAVVDPRKEVKEQMLNEYPSLKNMYKVDDGIFELLYLKNAKATMYSMTSAPESFEI